MDHYFINDKTKTKETNKIIIKAFNKSYNFYVGQGVFSKEHFDYGSRLLLENLDIPLKGNILDLGCGYGPVGIILADNYDVEVDMIDINDWAIELTKKNIELNKVKANTFISDVYSNITKKYSAIITNPPIRAGKEIVKRFLFEASKHLEEDGSLYFVMRTNHGVKTMMKELEKTYKLEVLKKSNGFYIIRCKNH